MDYKESRAQKNWCISTVVLEKTLESPLDWKEIQLKEISPEYSLERLMLKLKLSFKIWNSSTGIQSPPLALFVVVLSKAHLTSHSRMSGSRWVITPLWLSGSWRSFLYSSSVYSCHLFLIASASVRSIPFLSFIEPIFPWNVPLVSNFLEDISSLSHSVVFLYFFALITEEGFLISPGYSLEICIQMGISFLFSFVFCFSSFHRYL